MAEDGDDAEAVLARFANAGIDVDALATRLLHEGTLTFVELRQELMQRIADKREALANAV